jgi:hypothetical protein
LTTLPTERAAAIDMATNPKLPAKWPSYALEALIKALKALAALSERINLPEHGTDAKAKAIEAKLKALQYAAQRGEFMTVLSLAAEIRNLNADIRSDLLELDRAATAASNMLSGARNGDYSTTAGNRQ